jgi:hypothetical protein
MPMAAPTAKLGLATRFIEDVRQGPAAFAGKQKNTTWQLYALDLRIGCRYAEASCVALSDSASRYALRTRDSGGA